MSDIDMSNGKIMIEDQVIVSYVAEEIKKIDGVSRMIGGITESFSKNILGRESSNQGVKISRDGNNITITVHVVVYYGVNIPQISYDIQSAVKSSVEAFTGMTVDAVNIGIEGIDQN